MRKIFLPLRGKEKKERENRLHIGRKRSCRSTEGEKGKASRPPPSPEEEQPLTNAPSGVGEDRLLSGKGGERDHLGARKKKKKR